MNNSTTATNILATISSKDTKLGDLRKIANTIKKDHKLALELWSSKQYLAQQLAILIMNKKLLTPEVINQLIQDIEQQNTAAQLQLID